MITVKITSPYTGHDVKEWDPNEPGAMERIREFFEEKLKAGFLAFAILKDGKGKLITKFDEAAERIVLLADHVKMVQPARGG